MLHSGAKQYLVTFSAATSVLAASMNSTTDVELESESFTTFWAKCLSILNEHKVQITTAIRAIEVLETTKRYILSSQSRQSGMSSNISAKLYH